MKNEKIKIMVLRPQARLGLAPQRPPNPLAL